MRILTTSVTAFMLLSNLEAMSLQPVEAKVTEQILAKSDDRGPRGHRGRRGKKGHHGKHGKNGSSGTAGATGPAGSNGATGATGTLSPVYASAFSVGEGLSVTTTPNVIDFTFNQPGTPVPAGTIHTSPPLTDFVLPAGAYLVTWNFTVISNDATLPLNTINVSLFNFTTSTAYLPNPNSSATIPQAVTPVLNPIVQVSISGQMIVTIPAGGQTLQLQVSIARDPAPPLSGIFVEVSNPSISFVKIAD